MGILAFAQTALHEGGDLVSKIQENTAQAAYNTSFDFLWDGVCLIAVVSLIISSFTLVTIIYQFQRDRIDQACQYNLLIDIIRHLYRNKVCMMAMRVKYDVVSAANSDKTVYPSEEHYLKLQLLPSDIHLEQYYKDDRKFRVLHNIDLLLRNYNTEIETALLHVKNPLIDSAVKDHDFDTLNFKTGMITTRIVESMQKLKIKGTVRDMREQARNQICDAQEGNIERNKHFDPEQIKAYQSKIDEFFAAGLPDDQYFDLIFNTEEEQKKFIDAFKKDVEIECGQSRSGGDKINMIIVPKVC